MTSQPALTIRERSRSVSDYEDRQIFKVGIDTVKVGGTLALPPERPSFYLTTEWGRRVRLNAKANHYGKGPFAYWEASLPKAKYGHNLWALPVEETLDVLDQMYDEASGYVTWATPIEDLSVMRMDTVRDFTAIDDIPALLEGLSYLSPPLTSQGFTWRYHAGLNAVGFSLSGRWKVQLYDKTLELQHSRRTADPLERSHIDAALAQSAGTLRLECRTWSKVTQEKHLGTVGTLTPETIETVNRSYFEKCHLGQEVTGHTKIHDLMVESLTDEAQTKKIAGLVTYLFYESEGLSSPYNSPNTNRTYRNLAREHGLSSADFRTRASKAMRLDYDLGTSMVQEDCPALAAAA